jgi:glutamate-ammonia-ligase adenylyltransferase
LRARVELAIRETLVRPRDRAKTAADVREMRQRIAKEKATDDIWDLKQVRGGLVDIEFMAQYLQLIHAHRHPDVLDQNTVQVLRKLRSEGLLEERHADILGPGARLVNNLTQVIRLCIQGPFNPATAPDGLKDLLAQAGGMPDFERLQGELRRTLAEVTALFDEVVV